MNTVQNGKEAVWLDAENWGCFYVRGIKYTNFCNIDDDDDDDDNNNNNNNTRFQSYGHYTWCV
jgi:hypothetical protein